MMHSRASCSNGSIAHALIQAAGAPTIQLMDPRFRVWILSKVHLTSDGPFVMRDLWAAGPGQQSGISRMWCTKYTAAPIIPLVREGRAED